MWICEWNSTNVSSSVTRQWCQATSDGRDGIFDPIPAKYDNYAKKNHRICLINGLVDIKCNYMDD